MSLFLAVITFNFAILATFCSASANQFNLTIYDECGRMMNERLAVLDRATYEDGLSNLALSGLDNPDNSVGYSYSYIRTPPQLPTRVDIDLTILLLQGIDDIEQSMATTAMLHMRWFDERLAATDPLCHNISATYVINPAKNLPWFPQWMISNGRRESVMRSDSWEVSPVQVQDDGIVNWYVSFDFEVDCTLNTHYFPFDVQLCSIDLVSPQYDSKIMNYTVVGSDAIYLNDPDSQFAPLWKIAGVRYGAVSTSYPSISFKLMLTRRATFFVAALIIPTTALNIMTASLFITTANQAEKASSAMSCVTAYFFIEILFFHFSPVSSDSTPVLSIFFTFHLYFALFVCCVAARLIYYAEYVDEQEAIDLKLYQDIDVTNAKRRNNDGPRKFRSPEFYNDLCFILYVAITLISYVAVFAYLPIRAGSIKNNLLNTYSAPKVAGY